MSKTGYAGHCDPCGKWLYLNRAAARKSARNHYRDQHLAPYRCPVQESFWHLGNLSPVVINGTATRAQLYRGSVA